MKYIPYNFPVKILEFLHIHMNEQIRNIGDPNLIDYPTISDYYDSIPENLVDEYNGVYISALLKTFQLMINEGILTPLKAGIGFEEKYRYNEFNTLDAKYGTYDFKVLGFPYIHDTFDDAVRPVLLDEHNLARDPDIGSGFVINANRNFDSNFYFITARHCLPFGSRINVPAFLPPKKPCVPENIWMPQNENIDIAIIKFDMREGIPGREHNFWISQPNMLDEVLTMGYPPIPGFIDAIQVAEVARISGVLKSTHGRIVGEGKYYPGGLEDHFLVSARVKGGNSGGPVINKEGQVVGMIIELPQEAEELDKLGYGLAISSNIIQMILNTIEGKSETVPIVNIQFDVHDDGFQLRK